MQKNLGKIKRTVEEYVVLTVATLILVVGVYVFKFPNNFSFGGVTGLAVVLGAVLPTSPGNLTFIINMLLLVLGFIFLGRGFGVKTVYVMRSYCRHFPRQFCLISERPAAERISWQ